MAQSYSEQLWALGVDVIVTDSTSDHFGQVGSLVRIMKRDTSIRCSVNFDGDVHGFEKDDLQLARL